ncbi:hypothetical protein GMST_26380 [Geomonas silvestris]|uniref:Xanthan lyase n=1 Tax=Geomonas silvestris TaxID=2740184 RepID=A0A6V8MKQ8_9BACT|nr:FAD-dependent oxidoreductase [Geomonas silvestris]GFO60313.1 hypothetical protein GMST_26380 [Geomonas silvestris]
MPTKRIVVLLAVLVLTCESSCSTTSAPPPPSPPPAIDSSIPGYHLVVYGATAGGVIAAVSAAQQGLKVALIEPGSHVGGMVAAGLGATDSGNKNLIGGRSREFFRRMGAAYGTSIAWKFEPHIAEQVLKGWLSEAGVNVFYNHGLSSVDFSNRRINNVTLDDGTIYTAGVFIDASYEGDLMAKAGVSYAVGREGVATYQESLAGKQSHSQYHQFTTPLSAFDSQGTLLPMVGAADGKNPGDGDTKIPAYTYRLCLSTDPANRIPFSQPPGYDPKRYELLQRYLSQNAATITLGNILALSPLPNNKSDCNNNGPISTDLIGGNWDYPEADAARRGQIRDDHKLYIQGLLYFLSHDPGVPTTVRNQMLAWGLAKDEFTDTGNWPFQLYVREARRLIGKYVMTQADLLTSLIQTDSVGMGSYSIDSHHVQRSVAPDGTVINEGDVEVPVRGYQIPYRSIVPRDGECENLLVPVCISASHIAYSSLRMEPQYMILGDAAGIAAYLAVRDRKPVQSVDTNELAVRLRQRQQVLSLQDPVPVP